MNIKKKMINTHNPAGKLCYVIIAEVDGVTVKVEAEIFSGEDDPDAEISKARTECINKLNAMSKD